MPRWTREQLMAIEARNHTILVSAAAGSGKTAVLVERIVQLVKEGFRLNRMLIVTFTRAAAGEMRQRLSQRLLKEAAEEPGLFGQALDDLEGTDISTIHAFCQRVLRTEFQAVGIDPMARVCDEQQRKALFDQALRDSMNVLLDAGDQPAFMQLVDSFELPQLNDMAEALYGFMMSMPEPFDWLQWHADHVADGPWREHPWFQAMLRQTQLELQGLSSYISAMDAMFNEQDAVQQLRQTWEADRLTVEKLLSLCGDDAKTTVEALATTSFVRAAACRGISEDQKAWKERYEKLRSAMKDMVKDAAKALNANEDAVMAELRVIQQSLHGLSVWMRTLHERFAALKNRQNVLDFSDMEQMTLSILRQEGSRLQLQQEYDHIFVDECQDVSAVQDAIIQGIHGEHSCLFMVGDVKQSIYRFRLADPTLFLHRMRTFSDDEDAEERRIFLQKNFRSRTAVLDATNRVFRRAMQRSVTELDYLPEDELIPGRDTQDDPPVEIHLVDRAEDAKGGATPLECETAVVVRRIRELLDTTFMDGERERRYQYRDMVILLQKASGIGARLAELLQEQGVPVYFDGADNYYQLPEIRTVKALLTVIDNPLQDVPLLTALKAAPFSLTDGELADVRSCRTGRDVPFYAAFEACCGEDTPLAEKCRAVREQLHGWRFAVENMRLSDFVWLLIRDTGFYAASGAYPEGELRQANLRLLCQKAAEYENTQSGGLSGFLQMIDLQMQQADSRGAKILGENENLVRIMTMHKSKGLEFPVVFLMRMTGGMGGRSSGGMHMHNRLGVCLPYVNRALNIRRGCAGDAAFIGQRHLDELAERCRLLYVAMTRARERLIVTGCAEGESMNWRMPVGPFRVWKVDCMLDWLMQAVCDEETTQDVPWTVIREPAMACDKHAEPLNSAAVTAWIDELVRVPAQAAAHTWWNEERTKAQPLKTSVTSLIRQQQLAGMTEDDTEETEADKREPQEISMPIRLSDLAAKPAFLEEKQATGAEHGTVMHRLLSLTDLDVLKDRTGTALTQTIADQLEALQQRGCITEQERKLLRIGEIARFYESDIGQRVLAASRVEREWGFNLRISREQGTILQGIIDCAFMENGEWVLLDYKTDRITDEAAFVQHHQQQLNWYARALREITGVGVKECWLYALGKGQAYPVPMQSP